MGIQWGSGFVRGTKGSSVGIHWESGFVRRLRLLGFSHLLEEDLIERVEHEPVAREDERAEQVQALREHHRIEPVVTVDKGQHVQQQRALLLVILEYSSPRTFPYDGGRANSVRRATVEWRPRASTVAMS